METFFRAFAVFLAGKIITERNSDIPVLWFGADKHITITFHLTLTK